MGQAEQLTRYIRTKLEEPLILAAMAKIAFSDNADLSDSDLAVLAALRRSTTELQDASSEEIKSYLQAQDEDAIPGIVSNTKGILHEMQFVELENADGDLVYASIFPATNHPGTDVQLVDHATGNTWEIQLKATDSQSYANDWLSENPEGEILVTSELAEKTGLPSSQISNHELTEDVETAVDKMISDDQAIWDYIPAVTAVTLANIIWALWQRYQEGNIDWERFKYLAARASGIKVAKIALLAALLTLPVVGQATGALLVAKFLIGAKEALTKD